MTPAASAQTPFATTATPFTSEPLLSGDTVAKDWASPNIEVVIQESFGELVGEHCRVVAVDGDKVVVLVLGMVCYIFAILT